MYLRTDINNLTRESMKMIILQHNVQDSKCLSTKISWTLMPKLMYEQSLYVKIQI